MIRTILSPLSVLALAAMSLVPMIALPSPSNAAEPVQRAKPVIIDVVEDMLDAMRPRAFVVGRVGNVGFVQVNFDVGFFIRAQPNGQVRVTQATGAAIHAYAKANGWRI